MTSENVIFPRFNMRSASYTSGSIRIERPSPARGIFTTLWSHYLKLSQKTCLTLYARVKTVTNWRDPDRVFLCFSAIRDSLIPEVYTNEGEC